MIPRILQPVTGATPAGYNAEEWRAWQWLRLRFREGRDRWTGRELAHLRFLRWLAQTGRLAEDGEPMQGSAGAR